ncbi:unnamed protein product [Durusdinium trenchii]|uniref:Uncharacterized protein n=1 Tax=Durusdinium trenchii TaxID=1381693 RepID=A0ABP0P785_9DINO
MLEHLAVKTCEHVTTVRLTTSASRAKAWRLAIQCLVAGVQPDLIATSAAAASMQLPHQGVVHLLHQLDANAVGCVRWQLGATSVAECKKESEVVLFCGIYSVKTRVQSSGRCARCFRCLFCCGRKRSSNPFQSNRDQLQERRSPGAVAIGRPDTSQRRI